jgi:hypothetical protein
VIFEHQPEFPALQVVARVVGGRFKQAFKELPALDWEICAKSQA